MGIPNCDEFVRSPENVFPAQAVINYYLKTLDSPVQSTPRLRPGRQAGE